MQISTLVSPVTRQLIITCVVSSAIAILIAGGACVLTDSLPVRGAAVGGALLLSVLVSVSTLPAALKRDDRIGRQLAAFPADPGTDWNARPVHGQGPVEAGWNRLVETACHWRLLSKLEQQVDQSLAKGSAPGLPEMLNALAEGIVVTDTDYHILTCNHAFAAICDQHAEELIDQELQTPLTGYLDLESFYHSSRPMKVDFEYAGPHGRKYLQLSRRPQLAGTGEVEAFVWQLRDVTQQHLAEEAREQFVATATHELRTPLASIRAYAETLATRENIDREQQKKFYNTIQSEASRLGRFIDDLLDISRMQAGSLSLDCHETDIERLVGETIEKIQPTMDEKQLNFQVELPSKLPTLNIDKGKISAALVNLLGNAAKYTPAGGRVSFRVSASAQRIEFSVTDTGFGIAKEELESVFDRFFRSEDERVHGESGSGLGLTFTQEIARLHGGNVSVESELNTGSTFCLTLPIGTGE